MARKVWTVLQQTITRWARNDGNLLAAATAYYAAFSFFPLLLVLLSVLGFALKSEGAQQQLHNLIAQHSAPALAEQVQDILAQVRTRAAYSGPIGLVTLLIGAIGIFSQLESAFDRLWHQETPENHSVWGAVRNALWNRLKAFLTLVALGLVTIAAFVAELMFTGVRTWAEDWQVSNSFWQWNQFALNGVLNAAVFTLLYRAIPRARVRWLHALYGGLLVAVVWQIGSQLLARFVVGGNYSAYGVVGSFIAMMLWVYWASMVLYLGAQFVEVLGNPNNGSNNGGPKSNPSGNTTSGNTASANTAAPAKTPPDPPATG
jgi:membrane protein